MDVDLQGMFEKIMPKNTGAPRADGGRGPQGALRAGVRSADRPGEGQRRGDRAGREPGHHLPRRDRQGRRQRRQPRAPTSRARACSAICCRSSKGRRCRPSTATSRPTTSCSSPPARFIATKPSDLMPELQGRFPIRVELQDLTKDDFVRILTEPKSALTKQYAALLATEGVEIRVHARRDRGAGRVCLSGESDDAEHRRAAAVHDHGAAARRAQLRSPRHERRRRSSIDAAVRATSGWRSSRRTRI